MKNDMEKTKNLDRLCAEYGYRFAEEVTKAFQNDAKKAETLLTKALGVLQEQGLYAFALFCESRGNGEKESAKKVKEIATELLKELKLITDSDLLKELRKDDGLASDLEKLILAVQVLEKSLIYARFHAKAMKEM